jgi:hypothetical protein
MARKQQISKEEAQAKAAEKRARAKGLIEEALTELTDPGTWERFLASGLLVKMDGEPYSMRNQMLIHWQMPEATDVSGFTQWITRGRVVCKGETGILIYGPRKMIGTKGADGKVEDRKPEAGEEKVMRMGGVVIDSVFDISQTKPLEGKEFKAKPAGQARDLDAIREAIQQIDPEHADAILEAMDAAAEGVLEDA